MSLYAYTDSSYRVISDAAGALPGESVADAVPEAVLASIREHEARGKRNDLLRASDWTQLADSTLSAVERTEWAAYRQALRDLPQQPGFPDVDWPAPPTLPSGGGSTPIP